MEKQKQQQKNKFEDIRLCLLNDETALLDDKKRLLKEFCKSYSKKFLEYMEKSKEQTDFQKMS